MHIPGSNPGKGFFIFLKMQQETNTNNKLALCPKCNAWINYTPISGIHLSALTRKFGLSTTYFNKCHKCGYLPTHKELEQGHKLIEHAYHTAEGKKITSDFKAYNDKYLAIYKKLQAKEISQVVFDKYEKIFKEEFKELCRKQEEFNGKIVYK